MALRAAKKQTPKPFHIAEIAERCRVATSKGRGVMWNLRALIFRLLKMKFAAMYMNYFLWRQKFSSMRNSTLAQLCRSCFTDRRAQLHLEGH